MTLVKFYALELNKSTEYLIIFFDMEFVYL